jgi:NTP pyrophosphatase (non-canonical NTP hydrolase)
MNEKEYRNNVLKTLSKDYKKILQRINIDNIDLIHGIMGICDEAGELNNAIKGYIFYGKKLDKNNIIEELGDLFYYMNVIMNYLNITLDEVKEKNINKLKVRYKDKEFDSQNAINRNLKKEKKVLKSVVNKYTL